LVTHPESYQVGNVADQNLLWPHLELKNPQVSCLPYEPKNSNSGIVMYVNLSGSDLTMIGNSVSPFLILLYNVTWAGHAVDVIFTVFVLLEKVV